jgi:hypothetical protein
MGILSIQEEFERRIRGEVGRYVFFTEPIDPDGERGKRDV